VSEYLPSLDNDGLNLIVIWVMLLISFKIYAIKISLPVYWLNVTDANLRKGFVVVKTDNKFESVNTNNGGNIYV